MTGVALAASAAPVGTATVAPATAALPLATTVGGSRSVALLALAGLLLAAVLSVVVVSRLVAGYRRNGTRLMLVLGVGLALLVTGPIFLRLAFANLVGVSPVVRSLATTGSELLGLVAILYAIYDP